MSYEELLELEERMGEVKSKAANSSEIEALPVRVMSEEDLLMSEEKKK
jgi:hypothetical protein